MKIATINFTANNIISRQNKKRTQVRDTGYDSDFFEYTNQRHKTNIVNIYNNKVLYFPKDMDLSRAENIKLRTIIDNDSLIMDYNPERTEILYDNKERKNIEAVVLKSKNPDNKNEFGIHIFSKDLTIEYGQVLYSVFTNNNTEGIEEIAIKNNNKNISGLNHIADKYAVQYCKENNLPTNIVAYPKPEDYRANFEDGKRFVIPQKGSVQYNFLMKHYRNSDPNKIIQNILVDTSSWLPMKMYLPKSISDIYYDNYITDGAYLYNPIRQRSCYTKEFIDTSRPKTFDCYTDGNKIKSCSVEFNPKNVGQIYDKINKKPIDVYILKLHDYGFKNEDSFSFVSKDLKHEYGYVELSKNYKRYPIKLDENYPNEGIIGNRLVVSYLENYDDETYGGIGKLADKVSVRYCIENNIPTNIISIAGDDSQLAHYSRGKRFIKPEKDTGEYDFLMDTYGTPNPNKALKLLLNKSKKQGQKIDMDGWNRFYFKMFLPKHLVEKYKKEQY